MKIELSSILRASMTLLVVGLAIAAGWMMWRHYEVDPWTRDGKVRADIVRVAPDVPGLVTKVLVHENEPVSRGQALFVVDAPRYALALTQAQATVASAQAALVLARQEYRRNLSLGDLVSTEVTEQSRARVASADASLAAARAGADVAALNLKRTVVHATVDGYVANLQLQPGDCSPSAPTAQI